MPGTATPRRSVEGAIREFHISRESRSRYDVDDTLFALDGNVIFANFRAARQLAQRINERRDVVVHPELAVRASELNAMGLVDEILHHVIAEYRRQRNPQVMGEALTYLAEHVGAEALDDVLLAFVQEFPPLPVHRGEMTAAAYLSAETAGEPHREAVLEELFLLWLHNENPAAEPFLELFDDENLTQTTTYQTAMDQLEAFLADQPSFGPGGEKLHEMLRSPAKASPKSWLGQLNFIRRRWRGLLGAYLTRLLSSLDFLEEESKAFFGFGPGPAEVPVFAGAEAEPERFSPDRDWMPEVVMMAKNVYVWLDQLSKTHGREIRTLDQIPDEELDRLRSYGFTALWLIGLWERSEASKRIKQMMGNPDAVASAYSLKAYRIADDLGGDAAFERLKSRSWARGIRMASDMVPNHVGIDSDWVVHHPDWFVRLNYSPFPAYSFSGPDLCDDQRVGVYLEDHYYDKTDAAVVFQRRDHWTGDASYIYHGNDGTQMPWNDTAQLDYLNPEVREAVIQTILAVARRSPIIRFDAAMTLAKRHYQRLWYPEPGTGGDIPSRAEHGMSKHEFNQRMPEEFWREVVDRVAREAPDTLLLAEAFWMMEGYFVRTLGMHRVYNSAFMNMLRDEKNAEYRLVIKNTLEFDPEILRRYVNFLNNPDERTAVEQFGTGDKYFGVCTMMVTMPGLPMFGHGQIQGFAEKYGMEFRRAYWDERPNEGLIARHEQQIFPLAHKRYLFAGVDEFYLYDFYTASGSVDENVFAYSNRVGEERALVLYHNRYGDTRGWVRTSAACAVKGPDGEKSLVTRTLANALGISGDPNRYLLFRDAIGDLEYLRNCRELTEQGLYAELWAYQTHVFVDFREIQDNAQRHYGQLAAHLQGRGVPSIDAALREFVYGPVLAPMRMLVSAPAFKWLVGHTAPDPAAVDAKMLDEVAGKMLDLLAGVRAIVPPAEALNGDLDERIADAVTAQLRHLLTLPGTLRALVDRPQAGRPDGALKAAVAYVLADWDVADYAMWGGLLGWLFTHKLGGVVDPDHASEVSRDWLDAWLLRQPLVEALAELDVAAEARQRVLDTVRMLLTSPGWLAWAFDEPGDATRVPYRLLRRAIGHPEVQTYLGANRYEGVLWYRGESYGDFLWWILCMTAV
ncbi:MAG: alpha-amylase, partial [Anaerolineae bacterium]|nr:alpha-amylase [Anaerolineae bacterium]